MLGAFGRTGLLNVVATFGDFIIDEGFLMDVSERLFLLTCNKGSGLFWNEYREFLNQDSLDYDSLDYDLLDNDGQCKS